jgi:predicted SAM-dependent methyltransferase
MFFFGKANNYGNINYIGSKFRRKRFLYFEKQLTKLKRPITILDVGGTVKFWINENYHLHPEVIIIVLNIRADEDSNFPNIKSIEGNACNLSQFKNDEFDVVFSNSLIEHLYTKENQHKMASESIRVGKHYFIQTPNLHFPIEPHFKFPFFQYLPDRTKIMLQTKTSLINGAKYDLNYAREIIKEIKLLSKKEFLALFPDSELYVETFYGLEKSFIAHNFHDMLNSQT